MNDDERSVECQQRERKEEEEGDNVEQINSGNALMRGEIIYSVMGKKREENVLGLQRDHFIKTACLMYVELVLNYRPPDLITLHAGVLMSLTLSPPIFFPVDMLCVCTRTY